MLDTRGAAQPLAALGAEPSNASAAAQRRAAVARAEAESLTTGTGRSADGTRRTVGTITKFRDGAAQTDPFTPDYVVPPGHNPEELSIAHLELGGAVGSRLPAGRAEVDLIDRLRARRTLERALPPMTDEAAFAVRKRMM